ncbi:Fic family protein [Roseateles sp. LKC17W]|uniref:Fic family protein n=1 Tax=Pelomonas margarita TaxID=3299031 RepID=A0ABW7FQJ6_9BURK
MSKWIWTQPKWPHLVYDAVLAAPELAEAYTMHGLVAGKAAAIGLGRTSQVALDVLSAEVVSTAAIEGERLNADSVRSSVLRRLGLPNAGSSDRHVDGLVDVISDAMLAHDQPLTEERLCRWQSALFPGSTTSIRRIVVGRYRDHPDPMQIVSGPMGHEKVHYEAPPSADVPEHMQRFLSWFNETAPPTAGGSGGQRIDGLARAAIAHVWFESIHPFEDGNGRLGRAIVDMVMMQHLQPPVRLISLSRQLEKNRSAYYDALNHEQRGDGDVTKWVQWFATQCAAAYEQTSQIIDRAIEKRQFWEAHGKGLPERKRKVLQRLLDDGNGGFLGGLNADKYMKMTGIARATASRDLAEMVAARQLWRHGAGKAIRYYVNVSGWTHGIDRDDAGAGTEAALAAKEPDEQALHELNAKLEEAGFIVGPISGEKDRQYIGPVVAVTDRFAVQDLGRRQVVIHDLNQMDRVPEVAQRLEVTFKGGHGTTVVMAEPRRESGR